MQKSSSRQNTPQEMVIPFESLSESPTLLWRPTVEQQQDKSKHKGVTLALLPPEQNPTGPVLDVTNDDGSLSLFALDHVWAVMAHPRDPQARDEFLVTRKADVGAQIRELFADPQKKALMSALIGQWLDPHGGLASLLKARGQEQVHTEFWKNSWPGSVAGDVLQWIVRLAFWTPDVSVKKAIFLEEHELNTEGHPAVNLKGQHGPSHKRSLQAAWAYYKPAVHCWAAFRLWFFYYAETTGNGPDTPGPDWCNPFLREGLPGFLAHAELFRRIVTGLYAHGQSQPVLDPQETWQLPRNLQLLNVSLAIPALEDWALDVLETYRAE